MGCLGLFESKYISSSDIAKAFLLFRYNWIRKKFHKSKNYTNRNFHSILVDHEFRHIVLSCYRNSIQTMTQTKKIIFVCEHGAGKSVVAASYFNKLAKDRNLDYVAECRGTNPDSIVSLKTQEGLTKDDVYDANTKANKIAD